MKILLVEDDQNKAQRIQTFLEESVKGLALGLARSYASALKKVMTEKWDILLLDMSLPKYDISASEDGFSFDAFGGMHLLEEVKRKGRKLRAIILTQFESFGKGEDRMSLEELSQKLAKEFPEEYAGTVYYSPAQSDWQKNLMDCIQAND